MQLIKDLRTLLLSGLTLTALFTAAGCSRRDDRQDPVIARVGDRVITVSEFRRNYEFGMPFLKKGDDPRAAYLDYMIREKLLALEGYRLGFDRHPRVRENEKNLMPELLMEELFEHEIKPRVVVTPEEIREAIDKSKVRWKFRYWFEPNRADAEKIRSAMREMGYAAVVAELLESNPEIRLTPEQFESGYLRWLDVDPAILEAIRDLPLGEISAPLPINGVYVIFQITDIQRETFTENAYREEAESMRQTLFYRKALAQVRTYVDELMTPKDVRTKREAFQLLARAAAEWRADGDSQHQAFVKAVDTAGPETPHLLKLKGSLNATLTRFEGGQWTIADFLTRFDPALLKSPPEGMNAFYGELNQQLALTLRNHFLAEEARRSGLDKSERLHRTLQEWRDKWVYDESRSHFLRGLQVDSAQARQYFEDNIARYRLRKGQEPAYTDFREEARRDAYLQAARRALSEQTAGLQKRYPVTINRAVLDTVQVTTAADSRWMNLLLFKSGSRHLAVPIADPAWGM